MSDLATKAGTKPPDEIYLDHLPNLSVTEVGGLFKSRRVMTIGAPLLWWLSVDQLRSGIAHELGHFIGGDTRLTTFNVRTHALFISVLETMERDPFRVGTRHYAIEAGLAFAHALGDRLVRAYGRIFLTLTMPIGRRQELAADSLSARLVGSTVAAAALERIAIDAPLYDEYLRSEVGYAVRRGAMPTDLSAGFARLREQFLSKEKGRRFVEMIKTSATDPHDTHPALAERLHAVATLPDTTQQPDARPALDLFADRGDLDAWLVQLTRERIIQSFLASGETVGTVRDLPWSKIPEEAYAPAVKEGARKLAAHLHPHFPDARTLGAMFAALLQKVTAGSPLDIAAHIEPQVRGFTGSEAERIAIAVCADALGTLLQGALLERGAIVQESLGSAALVLRLGDESVDTLEALRLFARGEAEGRNLLAGWANRLAPHDGPS